MDKSKGNFFHATNQIVGKFQASGGGRYCRPPRGLPAPEIESGYPYGQLVLHAELAFPFP